MKITSRESFFSIAVVVLIVYNFIFQKEFIPERAFNWPAELRIPTPGYRLQPFKKYLNNVPLAGYYTDLYTSSYWLDPMAAVYLQQSQYTLSPTVLDINHCLQHNYLIYDCDQPGCFEKLTKLNYEKVCILNDRLGLLRKK